MKGEKLNRKDLEEKNVLNDAERRAFMEKYGRLTAAVPAGMLLLMGPSQSRANSSGDNDNGPP